MQQLKQAGPLYIACPRPTQLAQPSGAHPSPQAATRAPRNSRVPQPADKLSWSPGLHLNRLRGWQRRRPLHAALQCRAAHRPLLSDGCHWRQSGRRLMLDLHTVNKLTRARHLRRPRLVHRAFGYVEPKCTVCARVPLCTLALWP